MKTRLLLTLAISMIPLMTGAAMAGEPLRVCGPGERSVVDATHGAPCTQIMLGTPSYPGPRHSSLDMKTEATRRPLSGGDLRDVPTAPREATAAPRPEDR